MTKNTRKMSAKNARRNKSLLRDLEKIETQTMEDAKEVYDQSIEDKVVNSNSPKSKRPF